MKRQPTLNTLLTIIFSVFVCWSPAQALTQVATAVAVRGEVQALDSAGASRTLAPKAAIYEKDTIKTGERGQVQLLFTDNSIISLGRQSEMKVEEYRWQADQKDGALKTKIKEGTFRVMGGALATSAPQNFITETPTATIGIRGSMYAGKATARTLSVVFQGGKGIDVTNALGTVAITKPGFGTRVEIDKPLLPPVKFEQQDLIELDKPLEAAKSGSSEKTPLSSPAAGDASAEGTADSETVTTGGEGAVAAPDSAASPVDDSNTAPDTTLGVGLETTAPPAQDPPPLLGAGSVFLAPSTSLINNLQTDVVSDTSQTDLTTNIDQNAAAIGVDSKFTGRYYFFRRDIDLSLPPPSRFTSTFLDYTSGAVDASIYSTGQITGAMSPGATFGPYLISGYDPAATSYRGYAQISNGINFVDPLLGTIPLTVTTFADQSGQFFYTTVNSIIDGATKDYLLASLLFAGKPSASSPANRIDKFTGHLLYAVPGIHEANLESMQLDVNYYNKRLIGRSFNLDPNSPQKDGAIFFGTVDSTGGASLTILSAGAPGGPLATDVTSAYGNGSARLYGDFHQGLSFVASGNDYSLLTNAQGNAWTATGAALRSPASKIISPYPPFSIPFAGFVAGAADDTSTGKISRLFMNSLANEFTMVADPSSGVVSGSITAKDLVSGVTGWLTNLPVGGTATRSAYVLSDQMVAIISGSVSNPTLRDYGNFLITAGPDAPRITNADAKYLTWGTWEMAYTDPTDASKDHLFSSQSFWVAGQKTGSAYMGASLLNHPIVGTYDGKAFGVRFDALSQNASPLTNGATHLVINFNSATPSPVTGSIRFDQAVLTINSAASTLNVDGFPAFVSNVTASGIGSVPTSSAVNGAFYGPAAEAVGGNFSAKLSSGVGYYGIFGGNR